ncbi:MAG: bifunctional 2-C-methyl-D-erythritol 4-phosphate cytidylyltransferase/2-C-methyl-D-erythritol 2,4-cyclodiphosphate synthase [Sphingomonadales bacterium]|jgi:2-C-methyl-D-erythritol 4-phosphate cytidylyltransferase/2-C-methyl-D-erythritol 2,4-cyclodiphosphate synthase|nr:bifunctional 2-C-methyl-D-erythritol 4-phosphate cytidylyltransferase/2-C-methyl-D-erythritol 2,4-cyclodiphosphate synthase [Sphingomonadales bacterium]MBK9268830.1 bifunctional 2-C-methyl-D-erythritol 4-phosphate cytidylyltransferase/2-C-methyl-D-erythritol 2,4-cyclodiphosphate synthase [Sphingomonadales bacterium]
MDKPQPKAAAIIVAAGSGSRSGGDIPKQYRAVRGKPMLRHSVEAFRAHPAFGTILAVVAPGQNALAAAALEGLDEVIFVTGGAERRDSVNNAIQYLDKNSFTGPIFIHDAARPFLSSAVIDRLLDALTSSDGAVPALPIVDSLSRGNAEGALTETVDREQLFRIQTPQAFRHDVISKAHKDWNIGQVPTDDARMAMAAGFKVTIVEGDENLAKFTFADDFHRELGQSTKMQDIRTGMGYDVHRLAKGEELWLCGLRIDHDFGLAGHSDADVALHALTDAVLGAAALGDIGDHFPHSDAKWKGASSDRFLAHAVKLAVEAGFRVTHLDVTIICEAPKIGPHKKAMQARVAYIAAIVADRVSIKATTTEKLGFAGRGEGIAAQAIATLVK